MKSSLLMISLALSGCGANEEQPAAPVNEPVPAAVSKEEAPSPASYKAVGTEPGWALTIDGGKMAYEGDYGTVKIAEPTPANFLDKPGTYAAKRLTITITPGPCSDGMSDLTYRDTVALVADDKTVSGCGGGTITPTSLDGTNWTVAAINGRKTPGGPGYFLNFEGANLSAKFGCNGIGGKFKENGDHLSASELIQTEMACADPAASFERDGNKVLGSNMRVERTDGDTMRLVSEAGSIDLRRSI